MPQFSVQDTGRFQSFHSLHRSDAAPLCRCAGTFDEITFLSILHPETDIAGVLVVEHPEYPAISAQKRKIERLF